MQTGGMARLEISTDMTTQLIKWHLEVNWAWFGYLTESLCLDSLVGL